MRLPRFRNVVIPLLGALTTLMVTAGAAAAEDKHKKYNPAGIGDLLKTPRVGEGKGSTLYEQYGSVLYYRLDNELGWKDIGWSMLNGISDLFMGLTVFITQTAVVAVQWTLGFTDVKEIHDAITTAISKAGGTVSSTLLPSALAVGALVAWANHRKAAGSSLGQLGWVAASGILAVSLISTPGVWVDSLESVRKVGSTIAMEATSAGMTGKSQEPIAIGENPDLSQNDKDSEQTKKDKLVRKSTDAIWRSYVVTPWCIAEFGNLNTCKEFGERVLQKTDQPTDDDDFDDAREQFLSETLSDEALGKPAMKWRQGKNAGRVTVALAAFVCATLFAILAIILAFASLASLIGALMLLLAGVVFACLWVIPGRPRQWGLRWFDALLGFALQSFVSTMVLGVVLVLNTVSITFLGGSGGYFAASAVSITSAIVAFKFRAVMDSIVGVTGALTPGGSAMGMAMGRGASRLAGRMVGKPAGWAGRQAARPAKWAAGKAKDAAVGGIKMGAGAAARGGFRAASAGVEQLGKAKERGLQAMASWASDAAAGGGASRSGGGAASRPGASANSQNERRRAGGLDTPGGKTIATLPERRTTAVGNIRARATARSGEANTGRPNSARPNGARPQQGAAQGGSKGPLTQNGARLNSAKQDGKGGQANHRFRPTRPHTPPPRQQRISEARRTASTAAASGGAASRRSAPAQAKRSAAPAPTTNRRRRRGNS
ncbi:type IV secretion system protein [Streptomyces roseifaciens]|uniref:type IV secretion system protein n=1 Tax=Streptomyces roseifaciens TaxID=1488406 RepID=UPI0007180F16|nr:type IV secretion system protein [Streptomyces roseifaciens]